MGCVLHELLSLSIAFHGDHLMAIFYKICDSTPTPIDFYVPEELVSLSNWILEKDSAKRPNAQDILQSELMKTLVAKAARAATGSASGSRRRAASDSVSVDEMGEKSLSKVDADKTLTPKQKMEQRKRAESDKKAAEAAQAAKDSHGQRTQTRERHLAQQDSSGVKNSLSASKRSGLGLATASSSTSAAAGPRSKAPVISRETSPGVSTDGVLAESPTSALYFVQSPLEEEQMTIRDSSTGSPIGISPRTARRMSAPPDSLANHRPPSQQELLFSNTDGPESFLASDSYMASVRRTLGNAAGSAATSGPSSTPDSPSASASRSSRSKPFPLTVGSDQIASPAMSSSPKSAGALSTSTPKASLSNSAPHDSAEDDGDKEAKIVDCGRRRHHRGSAPASRE
jgi:hypothetical protein